MEKTIELLLDGEVVCIENLMTVEYYISTLWEEKDELEPDFFKEILMFMNKYIGKNLYTGSYYVEDDYYELADVIVDENMNVIAKYTYE